MLYSACECFADTSYTNMIPRQKGVLLLYNRDDTDLFISSAILNENRVSR